MPENTELEAFLQEAAPVADSVPPEPAQPASTGEPPPPPDASTAAVPDDDGDDGSPPSTQEGVQAVVPREALEAERRRRQDHKERAARFEGENAELRRQLEEAKRQQAPQQPQRPQQAMSVPDPVQDPQGYHAYMQGQQINHHLNLSEMLARKEMGDAAVDALIKDFREAMQQDPSLEPKLYQQRDPYGWAAREVERLRTLREMGDDPAAWRARIVAEERAKWEAEQGQQPAAQPATAPPASRVPTLAPSLAAARSAAPRSAAAWSGPATDEELFPPYRERKRNA